MNSRMALEIAIKNVRKLWEAVRLHDTRLELQGVYLQRLERRMTRLESVECDAKPALQRHDCIICGKWYEDDGSHVCAANPAPGESQPLVTMQNVIAELTERMDRLFDLQTALLARVKALEGKPAPTPAANNIHAPHSLDNYTGGFGGESKPAPVASEPGSIPLFTAKPRSDYWYNDYEPATPAQVRAEYERLFPAEVKRAKVAEAFLHAALAITDDWGYSGKEDNYELGIQHFREIAQQVAAVPWKKNLYGCLCDMAAVLDAASKDGEG